MKPRLLFLVLLLCSGSVFGKSAPFTFTDHAWLLLQLQKASVVESNNLLDNLTAYWPMEEANGANRLSQTNTHDLVNFGTVFREANHKEGSFSAGMMSSSWLTNYDAAFRLTNNWAMSTWFLFTNAPGANDTIISRWGPGASWLLTIEPLVGSNVVKFLATDSGQSPVWVVDSRVSILMSNWYNASYGIDGTNVWLQVNNESRTNTAWTSLFASSDPLGFGFNEILPVGNETGTFIDATGFWGRNLNTNDVRQLYNNGSGLFFSSFQASIPTGTGLKTSLVGYWAMEASDATDQSDSTASANTLTHHGSTIQEAVHIGGSFSVDIGSSPYLDSSSSDMTFGGSTDFSGTLWIYPTASFSDMAPLTAEWNVAHKILLWQRTSGGNKVEFVLRDGADANNIAVTSTVDCSLNNWHLIAYGFDHVSQKIWIQVDNETRVETSYTDTPPTPSTTTDKFTIGNYSGGGGGAINLHYDEAAFWKGRSLSTSDVSLIWNSGTGLFYASW